MYLFKFILILVIARTGWAGYGVGGSSQDEPPQSDVSAPRYSPSYSRYQRPSYGSYSSGGVKTGGVKTAGVKTSGVKTSGIKTSGSSAPYTVKTPSCSVPQDINNAQIQCSSMHGVCKIQCIPGYQLPNGQTSRTAQCSYMDGVWSWVMMYPEYKLTQPCEPLCRPDCQNGGICIAPDQCKCTDRFGGPQCQYEVRPCLTYPPLPMNAHRSCSSQLCTIKCIDHHQFLDGSTLANMYCREGQWTPARADWVTVPDCQPICDPPCQNGGACLSLNVCQCPIAFRGPQCQYSSSACSAAKLGFNGGYSCSGDGDAFWCELRCPPPTAFTSAPAPRYTCRYETGLFEPQPVPKCKYEPDQVIIQGGSSQTVYHQLHGGGHGRGDVDFVTPGVYHAVSRSPHSLRNDSSESVPAGGYYGTHTDSTVTLVAPTPGICFTWGGAHYKTFDGQVYSFQSPCRHVLVRDSRDHLFSVVVKHGGCGGGAPCPSQISIFLQDKEYTIGKDEEGGIIFSTGKREIPIPARLPGLSVTLAAHTVRVHLEHVGAKILWDTEQLVQVEASESLWNRTEGLCGVLDGHKDTDLLTAQHQRPMSIATLADSWELKKIGDICDESPSVKDACDTKSEIVHDKAEQFCKKLLTNKKFVKCSKVMDISLLLEACQWDYCGCADQDPEICACGSIAVYAKQCVLSGITDMRSWRDDDICPMKCADGKVYRSCGPESQPSCGLPSAAAPVTDATCTEGCFCPDGLYLDERKCVPKQECPCRLRNRNFANGAVIPKGCNTCKCEGGEWTCTQLNCGARCGAIGDPHYATFDGRRFDFMGKCSYHLLKGDNYTIDVENVACPGAISDAMNLVRSPTAASLGSPSCTKAVTIVYGAATIKLNQRGIVTVNGVELKVLPARVDNIVVRPVSSLFLIVELPNGIDVWWDTVTRVFVDIPGNFRDKTKGLCGTFNNNQKDDFLTPEGDVEQSVGAFANKWKTREACGDISLAEAPDTCRINVQNKKIAETYCQQLKGDLFKECHWYVDVEPFYQDCLYDMCACAGDVAACMCPLFGAYATECATQGVKINWRMHVKECELACSGGQSYQVCADSCARTCSDVSHNLLRPVRGRAACQPRCVEGCACPPGQALHANGECIPVGMCPCHFDGLEFQPGYKEVRDGKAHKMFCTCDVGKWKCRAATPAEILMYPRASDIRDKCNAADNLEFTTCESAEPLTCKNMHLSQSTSTAQCRPGCQCKKGYVLEAVSKKCVLPAECPCHHGGRSYPDGHKRPEECNTCECMKGKWDCTMRQCNGVCNAWGDTHFTTFDGKDFDFQGVCTYLMAQGAEGDNKFTVQIQNEPCGTTGATCAKSISLVVERGAKKESVTLTKHNPIPDTSGLESIKSHEAGAFVFMNVFSMGVVLQWDKATRVYIKVDPKWKNRVKGLCGNYNGDVRDDFQPPSGGGIAEASALLFADSWKLIPTCSNATAVEEHCTERPFRKEWATSACGAVMRAPFTACHSEVPPAAYAQRCERDACACDSGGDCECVCVALATYAQLCAARGVIFKWRSKDLCPCQCDEEISAYDPCISACPEETCENTLDYTGIKKTCQEDTCVEGCKLKKKCPEGMVFSNDTLASCVVRAACRPPCMTLADGRVVLEGETLEEDECHTCRCSRRQRVCSGQPCSTIPPAITTPSLSKTITTHPTPLAAKECQTGWSQWIASRPAASRIVNGQELTTVREKLPSLEVLANIAGLGVCLPVNMTDIECRTLGEHKSSKDLPLATACSLDRGLTCRAFAPNKCPEFEIRVFCQCDKASPPAPEKEFPQCVDAVRPNHEHPTDCRKFYQCVPGSGPPEHPHLVEKTCGPDMWYNPDAMICDFPASVQLIRPFCIDDDSDGIHPLPLTVLPGIEEGREVFIQQKSTTLTSLCGVGEVWSECATPCDRLCHGYAAELKYAWKCQRGEACEAGCVPEALASLRCEAGSLWRDRATCVPRRDCTCASKSGAVVKPGAVRQEECAVCQCHDNAYSCDESQCVPKVVVPSGGTPAPPQPPLIVSSTTTPPPACSEDRYKKLLSEAKIPVTLTASSVSSDDFSPNNAILNTNIGAGGWSPAQTDVHQYIQVQFPRREPLYGLVMQGSGLFSEYVTSYRVLYSDDGQAFSYINGPDGQPKVFLGSRTDNRENVKQMFPEPIEARYVRVQPLTWHDGIAVRFDVVGCEEFTTLAPTFSTTTTTTTITTTTTTTTTAVPITTLAEQMQCTEPMGLASGLPVRKVQVSSGAESARLLNIKQDKAWQPASSTPGEWIFFDFTSPRNITGIATKGGKTGWVTSYRVLYSPDHVVWSPVTDNSGREKLFLGNSDSDTEVRNMFPLPIYMQYMKILPQEWSEHIEMRVEPLGCFVPISVSEIDRPQCSQPMGLSGGLPLKDVQVSSGKGKEKYLDIKQEYAWKPTTSTPGEWIFFDFTSPKNITGVVTKGGKTGWVKSYKVLYSPDHKAWSAVTDEDGNDKLFPANSDSDTEVENLFEHPILMQVMKILPQEWSRNIEMRVEPLGCIEPNPVVEPEPLCTEPMGFAGGLPLRNVEVSSGKDNVMGLGLNQDVAWQPTTSTPGEWIFFDFTLPKNITGVVTKGGKTGWVKSYKVLYSPDHKTWSAITDDDGNDKLFSANSDSDTEVKIMFEHPIVMQVMKILPQEWTNNIEMRVEPIGCFKPYPVMEPEPLCEEPMGFSMGLPLQNVKVSSNPESIKYLHLNQSNAWGPTFSTPGEWIFFDYTGLRNITGIVTKGGKTGWIKSYKVLYSPDDKDWSPVTDDNGNDKLFPANFDSDTEVRNMFLRPIHMRYMKILPQEWSNSIEMRVEPLGCFVPYPVGEQPTSVYVNPLGKVTESKCQLCPGLISGASACDCPAPKSYFDGEECTTLQLCPCFVGLIPYQVGAQFKSNNCEDCTCKIGGVPDCVPTKCPKCAAGLVARKTQLCDCACEPCPAGERACPTSEVCVAEERWCDGVVDCPDDEIDCRTTPAPATTTTPVPPTTAPPKKECAEASCPAGYKATLVARRPAYQRSQALADSAAPPDSLAALPPPRPRKTYTRYFKGVKGGAASLYSGTKTRYPGTKSSSAFTLSKPTVTSTKAAEPDECPQFKCVSNRKLPPYKGEGTPPPPPPCPVPACPPHYKLRLEGTEETAYGQCPKYTCDPPPKSHAVCNVTSRTFNTFDGTEYKYDICDHLLARDANGDKWSVIIQKNCSQASGCGRELLVVQDGDFVRMLPGLRVEYNGYPYTVDQTKKIGLDKEKFLLSRTGDVLFYVSKKYGFWVLYNLQGDVKIGVPASLSGAVDGLCGYYDGNPENDRRLPAGQQVRSTELFGNAWSRPELPPDACEARACPLDLQARAWDMCSVIAEETLSACGAVLSLAKWRTRCLEQICECAQTAGNASREPQDCLCEALQSFVVECKAADRTVDLQGWRTETKCPVECPAPLVHHDCYRRRCEPACSLGGDDEPCPPAAGVCFPGCFCPEGKLRKGDDCIDPPLCRDCVCDGKGTPAKYTTFERADLPFSGNCTYIVARDKKTKGDYKFQVFVTNGACEEDPKSVCVEAVHIIQGPHVLHVQKSSGGNKLDIMVDGTPVYKSIENDWLELTILPGKDVSILIPEVQLEVMSLFKNMDFNLRIPSALYANKTEGLCGDCGGFDETMKTQNGTTTTDVQEYGMSWLAGKPALEALDIKVEKSCVEKPKSECLPPPPEQDPCFKILDAQAFGNCHPVVEPFMYVMACQQDMCLTGKRVGVCSSLEQYATECRRAGLCVDWRTNDLCPYPCEGDLKYKSCGVGCTLTCENYEELSSNPKTCDAPTTEGCFCPDGKVLVNNTCIEHTKCFPCDADNEHYAGDEWEVDACTKCACVKSEREQAAHVSCTKVSCSPAVCEPDQLAVKLPAAPTDCCPKYICVPKATEGPQCEEPQTLSCGFGQVLKLERTSNGCKKFSCQCKPASECDPLPSPNDVPALEPGVERLVDTSGCCPKELLVCKRETCPQRPACAQFLDLRARNVTGKCCPEYECVLPEDKCIVKLEWESKPEGGEKRRVQPETVLKPVSSVWMDGACRSCRCVRSEGAEMGAGAGAVAPQCAVTTCPPLASTEHVLVEPLSVPYQCCPLPRYVACKHADKLFKAGENLTLPEEPCVSYECVATEGDKLEKRTTVRKCDTHCRPGWEYVPAARKSAACCGRCEPVACVLDGEQHPIGASWHSPDHCTTFSCERSGAEVTVHSEVVSCPSVPEQLRKQFVLKVTSVPGECCKKVEPVACKVGDRIYKEGETWPVSPCVNATCARGPGGALAAAESVTQCARECPRGAAYREPADPSHCCGRCWPTACLDGDILRAPDTTWSSEDNCTTMSCTELDGQMVLSSHREDCPDVRGCPAGNLYTKGCCQHCKPTAESHTSSCAPEVVAAAETVGVVRYRHRTADCTNTVPLAGFTACVGGCTSRTQYNSQTGLQDSVCSCCRATRLTSLTVPLLCTDGSRMPHRIAVPAECACEPCS